MESPSLDTPIRLLMVEDDPDSGEATRDMLERRGMTVTLVHGVDDAFRVFSAETFDVLVADVRLEGSGDQTGVDILRRVRRDLPDFPVILFTGYDTISTAIEAIRLGAQDYIVKPLNVIEDLLLPVEKAVRHHRLLQTSRNLDMQLRLSEERYRTLFDRSLDAVYLHDLCGRLMDANQAAFQMLGYAREELVDQSFTTLFAAEDQLPSAYAALEELKTARSQKHSGQYLLRRKDGSLVWVEVLASLVRRAGQPYAIQGIARDITERKSREEELQKSWHELYRTDRVVRTGEMAASFAHELNQPLTGVLSNAQAAQRILADGNPRLEEVDAILDDIVADGRRAGEIINRLRTFLTAGTTRREAVQINTAVREILRVLQNDAFLRNILIETCLSEPLPIVKADSVQIQQVVLNLVLNAEQAMSSLPKERRRILVSSGLDASGQVVVSVRDRGVGIGGNNLTRVFDPFYTTRKGGMGMGLALSRSIVEAHGGRIWAEDNPDQGANVCFTIPVSDCGRKK